MYVIHLGEVAHWLLITNIHIELQNFRKRKKKEFVFVLRCFGLPFIYTSIFNSIIFFSAVSIYCSNNSNTSYVTQVKYYLLSIYYQFVDRFLGELSEFGFGVYRYLQKRSRNSFECKKTYTNKKCVLFVVSINSQSQQKIFDFDSVCSYSFFK